MSTDTVDAGETTEVAVDEILTDTPEATETQPDESQDKGDEKKEPEDATKPRRNRFQDRIREVVRERQQVQGENLQLKRRLEELETQYKVNDTPTRDKYENDAEFVKALTEHTVQAALQKIEEQKANHVAQQSQETEYVARVNKLQEAHADYDETIHAIDDIIFPQEVLGEIQSNPVGPELAYYLGKNPDEAAYIASLPATKALIELGKLEARVVKPAQAQVKPVSKAPAPIKPVTGGAAKATIDLNSKDVPLEQFMRERNAAEAAKHKRR